MSNKVLLLTFSGTGNTAICGEMIKNHLTSLKYEVTHFIYKKDKEFNLNPADFDIIGIGYPIHAFNVPAPFNKFLKTLPNVDNKKLFIYKVSGEPFHLNDASSYHFVKKLKKKGYNLMIEKHFLMPYNIMFDYPEALKKQMYLYLDKLTYLLALQLDNNETELIKYKLRYKVLSFFLRIEWIAGAVNSVFVHIKKDKCVRCDKCIKECPTNSVYLNKKGTIKIHPSTCCLCTKCAHDCPKDAITFGFMNLRKVNGKFMYQKLVNDKSINGNFVNDDTKGYFHLFNKYFTLKKEELKARNISLPDLDDNSIEKAEIKQTI